MTAAVARDGADAVAILCTNLRGARIAARLERELGVPVYDSVAVTVWKSLLIAGVDIAALSRWGSLFTNPALARPDELLAEDRA
jgi:maleate isomerase